MIAGFVHVVQKELEFEVSHVKGGDRKLLFINGFGGNSDQPGVQWFKNRFREHGLDVTYIQLPTSLKDFNEDALDPTIEVERSMGDHVAVGFSFGGLVLSFLNGSSRRIFMSPFWGVNDMWMHRGMDHVVKLLSIITRPVLRRRFEREDAGPLAVADDMKGIPNHVSFKTIEQFFEAHKRIPPPRKDDIVYYSPQDKVVSISKIEERGIEMNQFKGGHMFYLSRERARVMRDLLGSIDEGFDQSHSAN